MPELHFTRQGDGAPLVLLHGLFGSSNNWQSHARRCSKHFEVINVDLRNHGRSLHADAMNYDVMADDLRSLFGDLQLDAATVLGHSMGGKVAMMLARKCPELVTKLIIVDIAPVQYAHDYTSLINSLLAIPLAQLDSRSEADEMLSADIAEVQLRAFLLQNLVREQGSWRWRINLRVIQRAMEHLTGFGDGLSNWIIDQPSLFIRGAASDYIGEPEIDVIHAHFKLAEIVTVEDAGHWLHVEQAEVFAQILRNHWQHS